MKINLELMLKYILLSFVVVLSACCEMHTEVLYSYKDITITRIGEGGKTSFYYKRGKKASEGKMWAEYSGINDGFSGYLKFNENGKVILLSGDGYIQSEGLDTNMFSYKRILSYERPNVDNTTCYISLATDSEREKNRVEKSGIVAKYNLGDCNNQW